MVGLEMPVAAAISARVMAAVAQQLVDDVPVGDPAEQVQRGQRRVLALVRLSSILGLGRIIG